MKVLVLCTKFASETKAFSERGHKIVTLGIEGDVDILCDVRHYFPSIDDYFDVVFAHPPCNQFSKMNLRAGKFKNRKPDLSIVWACQRIIKTLNPRFWIMENPMGALRYFIGKPTVTIKYGDYGHYCQKKTDLWGNFPWFYSLTADIYIRGIHNKTAFTKNKKTADEKSLVPYGLSLALCKAIEFELGENHDQLVIS